MSALNGGLPKAKSAPFQDDTDFLNRFLDTMSDEERRILAQMPPVSRRTQVACIVAELREPRPELPEGHPLRRAES